MKKIFSIISACLAGLIVVFIVCTSLIKTNIPLEYGDPKFITVYNQSTTAIGSTEFQSGTDNYKKVLKELNKVTNVSMFNRLVNGGTLTDKPQQDLDNKLSTWSTEMKLKNIVVELTFDQQQDAVVYYNGDSKVVSYWCLLYVIPLNTDYNEIIIYYATTNDSTNSAKENSYKECSPIVLEGMSGDFKKFVKNLEKSL